MRKQKQVLTIIITFCLLLAASNAGAQFKVKRLELSSFLSFEEKTFEPFPMVRYNRVEGLFLGAGLTVNPPMLPAVAFTLRGGYGTGNEEWRYEADIEKSFFEMNQLQIGAGYFYSTSSLDDWYIGWIENSLAAVLFSNDYMNYFARKGFEVFINKDFFDNKFRVRLETANYDYESMPRETNWSLFRRDHKFRLNPQVAEGNETSLRLTLSYDGRDNPLFPLSGWLIDGIYERTFNDFETDGLFMTVRRYQTTFGSQRVRAKALLGARTGSIAEQHLMDLGGLGTLPGYEIKEYSNGNRLLLLSLSYQFGGDILSKIPLSFIPIYDAMSLSLFTDSGWLSLVDKDAAIFEGFDNVRVDHMKTDVGLALSVSEEMLVMKFAKRTDRSEDAWHFLLRLMYKF
ncbi:BamA/TamA family outer membrane protein [candidate division KSB1 bacterium]|nr:BamA/TamA family outer membrane protein [candidate division KSB1 bacterium]